MVVELWIPSESEIEIESAIFIFYPVPGTYYTGTRLLQLAAGYPVLATCHMHAV